jgi:hypothetical protein
MQENERLARIEMKIEHLVELLEGHVREQDRKNQIFFKSARSLDLLKATMGATWKTMAILGTVSATLGAAFAWALERVLKL